MAAQTLCYSLMLSQMSEEDFVQMARGELQTQKAFVEGKIKLKVTLHKCRAWLCNDIVAGTNEACHDGRSLDEIDER